MKLPYPVVTYTGQELEPYAVQHNFEAIAATSPVSQFKRGRTEVTSGNFTTQVSLYGDPGGAAADLLQLTLTPGIAGSWRVSVHAVVRNVGAVWANMQGIIALAPADADGFAASYGHVNHHLDAGTWAPLHVHETFNLLPNVTYTATAAVLPTGSTWAYWHGGNFTKIRGLFVPLG